MWVVCAKEYKNLKYTSYVKILDSISYILAFKQIIMTK